MKIPTAVGMLLGVLELTLLPYSALALGTRYWGSQGVEISLPYWGARPKAVADGSGGAFVIWEDISLHVPIVYVSRINGSGAPMWYGDRVGYPRGGFLSYQGFPRLATDAAGGVFIVWQDQLRDPQNPTSGFDVWAARVGPTGNRLWGSLGVPVCTTASNQFFPQIRSDARGGAIVVWLESSGAGPGSLRAQRLDPAGRRIWPEAGVLVSQTAESHLPALSADGSGGVVIAWADRRGGSTDIYAQRVDSTGAITWDSNGIPVCAAMGYQGPLDMESTPDGEFVVAWTDQRELPSVSTYAQRLSLSGAGLWAQDGIRLGSGAPVMGLPHVIADLTGGVVAAWTAGPVASSLDVVVQKVGPLGNLAWGPDGVRGSNVSGPKSDIRVVSDGRGGCTLGWAERRGRPDFDIYCQRLDAAGNRVWGESAVLAHDPDGNQYELDMCSDGIQGCVVVYESSHPYSGQARGQRVVDDITVSTAVSLVSTSANASEVRVRWNLTGALQADVQRRQRPGDWEQLGTGLADGSGFLTWIDRTISAGVHYEYRLRLRDGTTGPSVTVTIPGAASTRIQRLTPNPASRQTSIEFALSDDSPSELLIVDIGGRIVDRLPLSGYSAGVHRLVLPTQDLRPGVYSIVLEHRDRREHARLVKSD